jgi:hypothetical protein
LWQGALIVQPLHGWLMGRCDEPTFWGEFQKLALQTDPQ